MRLTLGTASLLLALGPRAVAQQLPTPRVLSLAQCEELALQHSTTVSEATANLERARLRRAQASHARYVPEFSLRNIWGLIPRARGEFTETGVLVSPDTAAGLSDLRYFTQVDLDIVQPLWTFGRLTGLTKAAKLGVRAGEADLEAKQADVLLQVRELYWGIALGYELLGASEDALAEIEKARTQLQEKLDSGSDEVSQTDLFKFQLFEYEVAKRHRETQERIEVGRSALSAAIGLDPTLPIDIASKKLEPQRVAIDSLSVYLAVALAHRPELARFRAGLDARSIMIGVSRSEYLPQFFLAAQLKYNFAKDRFDSNNPFVYNPTNFFRRGATLGFSWNLNFWRSRDKVRLAQLDYESMAEREPAILSGITLEVTKAYLALRRAEANLLEGEAALKASDNWLRAESQTYDMGVGDIKELIDAFRANGTMKAEQLQNIFEYNRALARLSHAVGRDLAGVLRNPG